MSHRSILLPSLALLLLGACASGRSDEPSSVEATFTVGVTPSEVTLPPGSTAAVTVAIDRRDGFAEEVDVSAAGLPAGISADPLVIGASQSSGTLMLRSGGAETATRVSVMVTAASGARTGTAAFELTLVGSGQPQLALTAASNGKVLVFGGQDVGGAPQAAAALFE